jgi:sugar lactone lactonase YvrE
MVAAEDAAATRDRHRQERGDRAAEQSKDHGTYDARDGQRGWLNLLNSGRMSARKENAMTHGWVSDTRVLLEGFGMGESPRWHEGRLWFSNWGTNEIVAVDLDGNSEVIGAGGGGSGWAVNWLRDGRMLVTGGELVRVEPDGSRVRHSDLGLISRYGWSEITVDGRGNAYVNSINFDFGDFREVMAGGDAPGKIALVTANGMAREVADGLAFPNGMAVTPDNSTLIVAESFAARLTAFDIAADGSLSNRRVWADVTGDGICIDAEGAVWCSAVDADGASVVHRVRQGGEVLDRIETDRPCYACMLGGEDGRTLFMLVQEWFGPDQMDELIEAKTGRILTARVEVPHAGWP